MSGFLQGSSVRCPERLCPGEDDLVISPGEAVEFTTCNPHWFGVVEEAVEAIMLIGPHGERAHLHP